MTEKVRLMVNGQEIEVNAGPDTSLLSVLRNHLSLVGARFGCGLGLCGSCDVILEDQVVHSCDTPLWSVAGKNVRTLEGLSSAGEPSPLQRAFIEEQAAQCGYCVAGIIMNATALLERNPNPNDAEVRTALDGNLCRCGAHNRMVRAVLRAGGTTSAAESSR